MSSEFTKKRLAKGEYSVSWCDRLVESMGQGKTATQFKAENNIPTRVFDYWKHQHVDFMSAIEDANDAYQAHWEGVLSDQAKTGGDGKDANTRYILNNRCKEDWANKQDVMLNVKGACDLTDQELDERLAKIKMELKREIAEEKEEG